MVRGLEGQMRSEGRGISALLGYSPITCFESGRLRSCWRTSSSFWLPWNVDMNCETWKRDGCLIWVFPSFYCLCVGQTLFICEEMKNINLWRCSEKLLSNEVAQLQRRTPENKQYSWMVTFYFKNVSFQHVLEQLEDPPKQCKESKQPLKHRFSRNNK